VARHHIMMVRRRHVFLLASLLSACLCIELQQEDATGGTASHHDGEAGLVVFGCMCSSGVICMCIATRVPAVSHLHVHCNKNVPHAAR
jgi:hypothetical protein